MAHPMDSLIEEIIRKAEAEGEFENLSGAGKPLPVEDDPQNALLRRLMKENKAEPEFVTLSRELKRLRGELAPRCTYWS